jgi:hypothetical protein
VAIRKVIETDIYRKFRIYPTRVVAEKDSWHWYSDETGFASFDRGVSSAATSAVLPVRRAEAQCSGRQY